MAPEAPSDGRMLATAWLVAFSVDEATVADTADAHVSVFRGRAAGEASLATYFG